MCGRDSNPCNLRQGSRRRIHVRYPVTREFENRAGKEESTRNVLYRIITLGCVLESSIRFNAQRLHLACVYRSRTTRRAFRVPVWGLGAAKSCDCLLCQYLRRQGVLEWRAGLAISQVDLEACADPLRRHDRCGSGRHQGEDRLPVGLGVLAFGTAALDDYRALWIEYKARPPDEGGNQVALRGHQRAEHLMREAIKWHSEDISGLST